VSVFLWLFNLILAGLVAYVFAPPFGSYFGESLALDKLMTAFDVNALLEFLADQTSAFRDVIWMLLAVILIYALAWPFFQGGILNTLLPGRGRTRLAGPFFGGAGGFYGRFLRLEVFSVVLWIPAVAVFFVLSRFLGLLAANPNAEFLRFVLVLVRLGLAVLVYNFIRMILDYARIRIALTDGRKVVEALVTGTRFVLGYPGRTFVLFYLFALTALPFLLGYAGLRIFYPQITAGRVAIVFLLGQVSILIRGFIRVAFQAGQMEFFRSFEAAKHPGRKRDQGFEEVEGGVHRDPHQAEGKEEEPDDREEKKGEQGQGPAED
jgi:hypothetical protein